jgi:hypothetical protein
MGFALHGGAYAHILLLDAQASLCIPYLSQLQVEHCVHDEVLSSSGKLLVKKRTETYRCLHLIGLALIGLPAHTSVCWTLKHPLLISTCSLLHLNVVPHD